MKPKVSVFVATSLDGYIARANGDLDWLDKAGERVPHDEDCGYEELMATVDVLVMGRKTYEKVLSFKEWPYDEMPVIVLSSSPVTIPREIEGTVTNLCEDLDVLCDELARAGVKHMYVDGGDTIQRFLAAGLVDELTLTTVPILLGSGTPLFGELKRDLHLTCVETKLFDFGFVQLKFRTKA